ncbi:helix-turn-helix domain-containing protein [Streptomyces sp. NPDC012637]|uniref:helix-turn-helix domain-containing protein n=1 Tax=Streptomyces sp. NPDC012637 TaxID=3364842 RepID=UPI0036E9350F
MVQAVAALVIKTAASRGTGLAPAPSGLPPRRLAQATDYIRTHLAERVALDDLARVAGVSPSHLTRVFRASTGQSPHQYVLGQRLEQARRALLTTDTAIADVADACGFADQSHLTRTMRRHLGLTPGALRTDRARTVATSNDSRPSEA